MFAQTSRGMGAKPPMKKKRCHPEGASADRVAPEGSRAAPIYKGRRGACTKWSAVNQKLNYIA